MSILVNKNTRVVVQGITGKEGSFHATQCKAYDTHSGRFKSFHLLICGAFASGNDGPGMPHPSPGRRCDAGNEANHRLFNVALNVFCSLLFGISADFTNHDHRLGFGVLLEQRQDIDKTRTVDGITTNAHTSRLPKT